MKFVIRRTSRNLPVNGTPCAGAVAENYIYIESLEKSRWIPSYWESDNWLQRGKNHRVEGGIAKRDLDETRYIIEINSIEDLIELAKEHGELVIGIGAESDPAMAYIEIYDGYRE